MAKKVIETSWKMRDKFVLQQSSKVQWFPGECLYFKQTAVILQLSRLVITREEEFLTRS